MTYITTMTPMVMMPRHEGKKHDAPSDYAAAWKALALKEGHRRGVPTSHNGENGQKRYVDVYATIMGYVAQGIVTNAGIAEKLGSSSRYANERLRQLLKDGKIKRNGNKWSLV